MNRSEAYSLLTKYLNNKNLLKHSLAAEVAMIALYKRLTPQNDQNTADEEKWGITGLLHDADYELARTSNQLDKHGLLLFEKEPDIVPEDITHAIKSHNYKNTKVLPESLMDWSITACDQLTGLIVAAALVLPDKKLSSLTADSVLKRMKSPSFAKGADREAIKFCETELKIPLPEFVEIVLKAMQSISDDLGL
ncbi:MAG TPA: hypothetical protein VLG67_01450 [Candidatus Saccharimonadales bacterium]|nr:hypothetical protein [Candidatus Saccharimonadales bacterium]